MLRQLVRSADRVVVAGPSVLPATRRLVHAQRKATGDPDFKTYKPVTPGLRQLRLPRNDHLYKGRVYLPLSIPKRKTGGRNNTGRMTVEHIGGGHKQRIRLVDFQRRAPGEQVVQRIEYDPCRSAHIALIKHKRSEELSYILAPEGLREGDVVQSFRAGVPVGLGASSQLDDFDSSAYADSDKQDAISTQYVSDDKPVELRSARDAASSTLELGFLRQLTLKPGNFLPLRLIPQGVPIHSIALQPNTKGQLVRSAGSYATVVAVNARGGDYAQVKLASGEVRFIHMDACAAIGKVSNRHHKGTNLGKAGRSRWLGRRPSVRGVAMNKSVPIPFRVPSRADSSVSGETTLLEGVVARASRTTTPYRSTVCSQRVDGPEDRDRAAIGWWRGSGQRDLMSGDEHTATLHIRLLAPHRRSPALGVPFAFIRCFWDGGSFRQTQHSDGRQDIPSTSGPVHLGVRSPRQHLIFAQPRLCEGDVDEVGRRAEDVLCIGERFEEGRVDDERRGAAQVWCQSVDDGHCRVLAAYDQTATTEGQRRTTGLMCLKVAQRFEFALPEIASDFFKLLVFCPLLLLPHRLLRQPRTRGRSIVTFRCGRRGGFRSRGPAGIGLGPVEGLERERRGVGKVERCQKVGVGGRIGIVDQEACPFP